MRYTTVIAPFLGLCTAGRLREAKIRDAELPAFHFYRLAESCIACHSQYARQRFPGFETAGKDRHRH